MHPNKDAELTAYYREQASACATKALATAINEIKQAYLDLEQGWLCLAPKIEERPDPMVGSDDPSDPRTERRLQANRRRAIS